MYMMNLPTIWELIDHQYIEFIECCEIFEDAMVAHDMYDLAEHAYSNYMDTCEIITTFFTCGMPEAMR